MLCQLCSGDKNPEENRFCSMCGMPLEAAIFKPAVKQNVTLEANALQDTTSGELRVPTGIARPANVLLPDDYPAFSNSPDIKRDPAAEEPAAISDGPCSEHELSASYSTPTAFLGLEDLPDECLSPAFRPGTSAGISGPSFLGLGRDQPSGSNPLEEEPRSHWRGYLLALIIVGLAVLGCLQWRTEVQNQAQKVAAMMPARMNAVSPQTKAQEPAVSAENTPLAPVATFPPNTSEASVVTTVTPTSSPATPAEKSPTARNVAAAPSHVDDSASKTRPPAEARTEKPTAREGQSSRVGSPKRRHQTRLVAQNSKFTSRPPAERANNMLAQAQKYLRVRDCQHGMVYLQQAVRHRSPEALSQMGALYATGMCVQQNRVEAYNWFSSALDMDPGNPWLTRERHILYGEMTSTERRETGR